MPRPRTAATGSDDRKALVVGSGLIGASIGMALGYAGWQVQLADRDPAAAATAAALGAGVAVDWPPAATGLGATETGRPAGSPPLDIVIVAVPPAAVATAIERTIRLEMAPAIMHVASVQAQPLAELEARGVDLSPVVGTHPMAGSERGGPGAGSPALFHDRPWVVCPAGADPAAVVAAEAVVAACGGRVIRMAPDEHDRAVALVSHLPQLASSAVSALLTRATPDEVTIAGAGLRDVTRLGDADPDLWAQIVGANAAAVAPLVEALRDRLDLLARGLRSAEQQAPHDAAAALVADGRHGRRRLGGKHGGASRHWGGVQLVIPDQPGALVDVLTTCHRLGVNVEDLRLEHTPGRPNGLLELLVEPSTARRLATALGDRWDVVAVLQPHD